MKDALPIVVEPSEAPQACVIWLHGLGADGGDFEPVVPQLAAGITRRTRFIFPHAPLQAVTINGGAQMRAWYDIAEMDLERRVDGEGVKNSAENIAALLEEQHHLGIPYEKMILAGFSQGGAIALHLGLRLQQRLAGIMALSTYITMPDALESECSQANAATPIFLAHGSQDPMVPLAASENARQLLRTLGYRPNCHTYPMAHAVCAEELRDISCWLEDVLDCQGLPR